MNAPKLRFKEFNDEWVFDYLKNITSDISYGMNSASKEFDGINKYIRITDIDENSNKYKTDDIVSPDGALEEKFLVKENDILFARTGASTGKTYLYDNKDGKLYYAGFLIKASIINHNSNFIFQQTKLPKYYKWIKTTSMRSGQPGINSQEYGSCKFSITSPEEENKIANFLSLLDKKIELQIKKIEDLKLFKKGLLFNLFNKYETETINLNKIIIEYTKKTTINNQFPILSSTRSGLIAQDNYFNKQTASQNNIGYKILPRGYITYRSMSDDGYFSFNLNNLLDLGIVSPAYPVFNINEDFNKNYVLYYMNECNEFKNQLMNNKEGGTRYALSLSKLKNCSIKVPSKEKQKYISNIINLINNKELNEITKLNKLQDIKKGLMQNLFV